MASSAKLEASLPLARSWLWELQLKSIQSILITMQLIKALVKLCQVGWWVDWWVGSMVAGWVILGLILVQLKLKIQLGPNFGNKKIGRVNPRK